jgi:hypothetical protein
VHSEDVSVKWSKVIDSVHEYYGVQEQSLEFEENAQLVVSCIVVPWKRKPVLFSLVVQDMAFFLYNMASVTCSSVTFIFAWMK